MIYPPVNTDFIILKFIILILVSLKIKYYKIFQISQYVKKNQSNGGLKKQRKYD